MGVPSEAALSIENREAMGTAANRTFGQWKILLVAPGQGASQEINALIHNHLPYSNVTELKDYPSRSDLAAILPEHTPSLCFVDVEKSREWALPMLSDLSGLDPKLPVVAIHGGNGQRLHPEDAAERSDGVSDPAA